MQRLDFKTKKCLLKNLTWLGVGGSANIFKPENTKELCNFVKSKNFFTIGAGSNILAPEKIDKCILRLGRNFNYIKLENDQIVAGCAALDTSVARFALDNRISGFEFFSVIPGTVGGAIAMNAGAYGSQTSDVLKSIRAVNDNGEIIEIKSEQAGFQYRCNKLSKDLVFFEAIFEAKKGQKDEIKGKMAQMIQKKQQSQPLNCKTCGSIFKNPHNKSAWQLIDSAGFRGFCVGKAQISEKHCNFLINNGCKTSEEIEELCYKVQEGVKKKHGITMEMELVLI